MEEPELSKTQRLRLEQINYDDGYGYKKVLIVDDNELIVYFTPAVTGSDWLWSYDLWSATYDISSLNK